MNKLSRGLLALGVVSALALTGCSGGTGANTNTNPSAGTGPTTIKLVAAEYSKDHTKAFWDQFATAYKAKTGNTLEVQIVSWDNIDQQSSTMIQNNQAPDILNLNVYASYAKDGLLWSADDVLSSSAKSDLLDAFVTYGTYNGKLYGFPDLSSARAFFYNKDLFAKAGITQPLDRSRFGGGWGIFRGFLNLGGTDDGIDTEGIHRGVQSLGGRVRDQ